MLIAPKAKLYSRLNSLEIPNMCYAVRDRVTDTILKMQKKPLVFTNEFYAYGYMISANLDAVIKTISWETITDSYDEIVLDYVDDQHEIPVFNVSEFMIQYYMTLAEE